MFYENVGAPVRSSAGYLVLLGLALLLVGMGYSLYLYHKASAPPVPEVKLEQQRQTGTERAMRPGSAVPFASAPQTEWPKLVIPPRGRSGLVRRPPGMHIVMAGYQFRHIMVFPGGTECSFGQQCPDGPIGGYAQNEAGETNTVSYAFEK